VRAETYREEGLSRVRMVLERVSESRWFGGAGTSPGVEVDEQEGWLARRRASALRLPASDLRAIDEFRTLARHSASAVAALRAISEQHARYGPD
jgi:hypothetical protein